MSFLKEFKAFAMKGNVVDMAVGIIIGGAFGKIVSSLVSDIIMPPIGLLIGGVNFKNLVIHLKPAEIDPTGKVIEAVNINYGNFIQTSLDFLIIAFSIFFSYQRHEQPPQKTSSATASRSPHSDKRRNPALRNQRYSEREKADLNLF